MAIESLLNPQSIAIVGASDRIGPGFNAWQALMHVGYQGQIHLVNPNKSELFGRRTYPSLADIEADTVDAVFAAVRSDSTLEVMHQAIGKRVGGMTILSSGFGDAGPEGAQHQRLLADLAISNNMAVCGPNCLGLLNFAGQSALFGTSLPDRVPRGGVAAVVQSGSIGIALLNSGRDIGLSHLITSGNEAVTAIADYLEALIPDPSVEIIIAFAEQIRKPDKFIAMARRARACGKPLIVLKSGRSESGRAAVMAHTGAVAGSTEACDAALQDSGAIVVDTLDELLETATLASGLRRRPATSKVAAVSLSGGEIALVLDASEDSGLSFADLGAAKAEIASLLPDFAHISNPLDLTWAGLYDANVAEGCARAMASLEEVGSVVIIQDAPTRLGSQQASRYAQLLQAVARGADHAGKPLIALSNLSDEPHPELSRVAREAGVPYLRGTREGLSAIARYVRWASPIVRSLPPVTSSEVIQRVRDDMARHAAGRVPTEYEARSILGHYGIQGPPERFVTETDEVAKAAEELGFPVVLKGVVEGLAHKTEAGLVKLRLADASAVRDAATRMVRAAAEQQLDMRGFLIQKMMSPVAELLVGARVDPEFGPIIVVGGGGIHVELYRDVAIRLAPITPQEALAALAATRSGRLLDGWRGAPACDKMAVGHVISALSRFMADFADRVEEVEINPLAVYREGQGCMALDCVMIPARDYVPDS
jgi:acyl-CoA synthetase (NDP forming)